MTLRPQLQELVDATRELDAEPPDVEDRMWTAIMAAVGPGGSTSPEPDVPAPPSTDAPLPGASSSLPTVIKVVAVGLAGIGFAVGMGLATTRSGSVAPRSLAGPVGGSSDALASPPVFASPAALASPPVMLDAHSGSRPTAALGKTLARDEALQVRPVASSQAPAADETFQVRSSAASRTPAADGALRARPSPSTREGARMEGDTLAEETRLLRRARTAVSGSQFPDALRILAEHAERFPRGALREARMALEVEALCGVGRNDEAQRASERFGAAFPRSALRKATWCTR